MLHVWIYLHETWKMSTKSRGNVVANIPIQKGASGIYTNSDLFVHLLMRQQCKGVILQTTPLKVFNIHRNFLQELGSFCSFKSIFFRSTGLYLLLCLVHLAQGSLNITYLGVIKHCLKWIHSLMDFPLTVHCLGWLNIMTPVIILPSGTCEAWCWP